MLFKKGDIMIVGLAIFKVKKGKDRIALKHMRTHLKISQAVEGFIHGYIAKSAEENDTYLVIEEYENYDGLAEAQKRLYDNSILHPDEYMRFTKIMQEKPRYEVFRKRELTPTKISEEYRQVLKKMKETKIIKKEQKIRKEQKRKKSKMKSRR